MSVDSASSSHFQSIPNDNSKKINSLFVDYPDVVVVGAGFAGLSFLLSLFYHSQRAKINLPSSFHLRVLERDVSADDVRASQGYTLSVRSDAVSGGVQVLDELGLMDEVDRLSTTSHGMMIVNAKMEPLAIFATPRVPSLRHPGVYRSARRIRRYTLRELLLKAALVQIQQYAYNAEIQFNKGVKSALEYEDDQTGRRKVELTLLDDSKTTCDLLIVADGANSKVRHSITPTDRVTFNGAFGIGGTAIFPLPSGDGTSNLPLLLQQHHISGFDGFGHNAFLAAIDDHRALWFFSEIRDKETSTEQLSKERLFMEAQRIGSHFNEPVPTLMSHTQINDITSLNCRDKIPTVNSKLPTHQIIFLGDASHAVSPFAGNGANMALMDGFQLAKILIESNVANQTDRLSTAIKQYDDMSYPRSKRTLDLSHHVIAASHSTGFRYWLNVRFLQVLSIAINHPTTFKYTAVALASSLIAGISWLGYRYAINKT